MPAKYVFLARELKQELEQMRAKGQAKLPAENALADQFRVSRQTVRQALALLMATMTPLKFLILDEHTAALDPKTAAGIMELTDRIVRKKKLTALMVTHNLRYALDYGDRLLMLDRGKILLDRTGAEKAATSPEDVLSVFQRADMGLGFC